MPDTPTVGELLEEDKPTEDRVRRNITVIKLRKTRAHAREVAPFVPLEDFDYTWLRAGSPFEFVEFGELAYLRNL